MFHRLLGREQKAQDIGVELAVEFILRHFLKRREPIDAGIVDEHVERAEGFFCLVEQPPHLGGLRYVGLNRDGLAALAGDVGDDPICALLAGGVIDDYRGARGGEPFGDLPAPMPFEAPVTIATLPVSSPMRILLSFQCFDS